MAFSNYKSISTTLQKIQIKYVQFNFMLEGEFPVKQSFKEELDLLFTNVVIDNSENTVCENILKSFGSKPSELFCSSISR